MKLKLPHLMEDDVQKLINHFKVNDPCSTYKLILFATLMFNNEAIKVSDLIKTNIEDNYMKELYNMT